MALVLGQAGKISAEGSMYARLPTHLVISDGVMTSVLVQTKDTLPY